MAKHVYGWCWCCDKHRKVTFDPLALEWLCDECAEERVGPQTVRGSDG